MKTAIVSASQLTEHERWDARYHILLDEHEETYLELMEKFEIAELVKLAADLPFDAEAAACVFPRLKPWYRPEFLTHIDRDAAREARRIEREKEEERNPWRTHHLEGDLPVKILKERRFKKDLATYCAAAARGASYRVKEELLRLARLKLEVVRQLHGVKTVADKKGAEVLKQLLKGQTE